MIKNQFFGVKNRFLQNEHYRRDQRSELSALTNFHVNPSNLKNKEWVPFSVFATLLRDVGWTGFEEAKQTPGTLRFWRSMACFEGTVTGDNISKIYIRLLGRADGTSENVREKRVFYMATAQSRVRADGHISATEWNFFKRSKAAHEGQLRAQRSAKISTSIFGGGPTLV